MLGAGSISAREGRICLNFLLLVVVLFYVSLVFLYTKVYLSTDEGMKKMVKFLFSKKATNIDEIFTVDLTLCSKCQIDGEDFVIFVAFSENTNFKMF